MSDLGLIRVGDNQITPTGALYIEQLAGTLHRVKKYRVNFMDKTSRELSHKEYLNLTKALMERPDMKFVRFSDGSVVSTNQIVGIKPYEVIVDTRKEDL